MERTSTFIALHLQYRFEVYGRVSADGNHDKHRTQSENRLYGGYQIIICSYRFYFTAYGIFIIRKKREKRRKDFRLTGNIKLEKFVQ